MRYLQEHIAAKSALLKETAVNLMTGTRVQMLINREIGNTNKGSMRWVNKLVSYDEYSYKRNVEKLMFQMHALDNPSIRLYASVNQRNHNAAAKLLIPNIIDNLDNGEWLSLMHDKFVSSLMNPLCRSTKYFLIDCDSYDSALHMEIRKLLDSHLIIEYPTVKGRHFVTSAFDTRNLLNLNNNQDKPVIEVKRDGLILLCWYTKEDSK